MIYFYNLLYSPLIMMSYSSGSLNSKKYYYKTILREVNYINLIVI